MSLLGIAGLYWAAAFLNGAGLSEGVQNTIAPSGTQLSHRPVAHTGNPNAGELGQPGPCEFKTCLRD